MKLLLSLCMVTFLVVTSFAQENTNYDQYVDEAWKLYEAEDYKASAERYAQAFAELDGKARSNDRYNAACSYALAGDPESAFYHLFYLAENPEIKYKDLDHVSTDKDLISLHEDIRWVEFINTVTANKKECEKDFDHALVAQLDSIFEMDQGYRHEIAEIEKKYGQDSEEMQAHWQKIHHADSLNLIAVQKILDERGWLGSDVIGGKGNMTLFLVIQHSDLEIQEKYLPMMREAAKKGNASPSNLAMLEDRVAMRKGEKQIYGSQLRRDPDSEEYYVYPLIEPEKVNERRAEVGLGSIEDYVKNFGLTWDLEEHKERVEEMEGE